MNAISGDHEPKCVVCFLCTKRGTCLSTSDESVFSLASVVTMVGVFFKLFAIEYDVCCSVTKTRLFESCVVRKLNTCRYFGARCHGRAHKKKYVGSHQPAPRTVHIHTPRGWTGDRFPLAIATGNSTNQRTKLCFVLVECGCTVSKECVHGAPCVLHARCWLEVSCALHRQRPRCRIETREGKWDFIAFISLDSLFYGWSWRHPQGPV